MEQHADITRTSWGYDARGLTSLIRHTKTDGTLLELASYSYGDAGNPSTRTTNAGITTWSYDDASQLLSEKHSSGAIDTWRFDPARNYLTCRLSSPRSAGAAAHFARHDLQRGSHHGAPRESHPHCLHVR